MSNQHVAINRRKWALVRREAFERDGYRCRACGRPGRLEAHHEPPLRKGADPYRLEGVMSMCRGCHIQHHRDEDKTADQLAWTIFIGDLARAH